jgi:PAS domain S-box-containing protein
MSNPTPDTEGEFRALVENDADAVARDVTGPRRLEEALRQSEVQFRGAFSYAAIGMALVAPDGRWLRVNRSLCETVGYTEDELLARTLQDITHPDDLDADLGQVRRMLTGDIPCFHMEKRYFHKDGRVIWGLLSVALVHDVQGRPLHLVSQVQDVTARKQAEAERESLIRQLQEALARVKRLRGLLPVCAWCRQVRNDRGHWQQLEAHIQKHLDVRFTHAMCPSCLAKQSAYEAEASGSRVGGGPA